MLGIFRFAGSLGGTRICCELLVAAPATPILRAIWYPANLRAIIDVGRSAPPDATNDRDGSLNFRYKNAI